MCYDPWPFCDTYFSTVIVYELYDDIYQIHHNTIIYWIIIHIEQVLYYRCLRGLTPHSGVDIKINCSSDEAPHIQEKITACVFETEWNIHIPVNVSVYII